MKIIDINKIYGKLKMKCFEMPNASYTNRCAPLKKNQIVKRPLGIYDTKAKR